MLITKHSICECSIHKMSFVPVISAVILRESSEGRFAGSSSVAEE